MNSFKTFSILDYCDKLEPTAEGKYNCPGCNGHNLSINKETGAYSCWNGCQCEAIREAIAPWSDRKQTATPQRNPGKPNKQVKPAPLPEKINLARLPQSATDSPQPQKRLDKQHGEVDEWVYDYGNHQYKTRTQRPDPSAISTDMLCNGV